MLPSFPWCIDHQKQSWARDESHIIFGADGRMACMLICPDLRPWNGKTAALIVTAVNNHADLLAALKAARPVVWNAMQESSSQHVKRLHTILDEIDAVIARAEGGGL